MKFGACGYGWISACGYGTQICRGGYVLADMHVLICEGRYGKCRYGGIKNFTEVRLSLIVDTGDWIYSLQIWGRVYG